MGSEPVEGLPDDLEAWVAEQASDADTSRADVVRRLMAAHQLLDESPDRLEEMERSELGERIVGTSDADSEIDDLDARVEDLAGRVGELEADLDEKIDDVRQRVIQVKREADAKASADHDHPAIERRIDEGFGNYEEILEHLTERTETLQTEADDRSAKLRRVANAVVDLRRRISALESELEKRAAVSELREAANRRGISEAACGSCGKPVQLGLLEEPSCPHCESPFDGVEAGGWFRSNRLTVGDRPALESGPATAGSERTDARERDAPSEPSETAGDGLDGADGDSAKTGEKPDEAGEDSVSPTPDDGFAGQPTGDGVDEAPDADGASTAAGRDSEGTDPDDEGVGDR